MTQEDYVSFETAKLLKDKGFDENCSRSYVKDKLAVSQGFNNSYYATMYSDDSYRPVSAPTIQMAMKWLREVHKLFIDIRTSIDLVDNPHFNYSILNMDGKYIREGYTSFEWKYEEACEAAIKYCLENLI